MTSSLNWQTSDFNSRPSARGDIRHSGRLPADAISIHAPPRGATHQHLMSSKHSSFQFTPLREGRPDGAGAEMKYQRISIHAPPRGATAHLDNGLFGENISIHAPPRGATMLQKLFPGFLQHFNSRPSARGDKPLLPPQEHILISIHAPPRGATSCKFSNVLARNFNSRPSARGDDERQQEARHSQFQFTPLREGRRLFWKRQNHLL